MVESARLDLPTLNSTVLLAPAVVESGGCITCNLDYEPGFRSVVARLFRMAR